MKIVSVNKFILSFLFVGLWTNLLSAQSQTQPVIQESKFEQLLNEKRKINASLSVNESYKIQIFSGNSENAKKTLSQFRQEFSDVDATIVFNTPSYKVWVGNFKTRIEAERNLVAIQKNYKNVLLIKPAK